MKAIFKVAITKPGGGIRYARKKTEIDFMPISGMQVEDGVWKCPVKVVSVCYGIESKELFITLENHSTKDENDQNDTLKMYKSHDWETNEL